MEAPLVPGCPHSSPPPGCVLTPHTHTPLLSLPTSPMAQERNIVIAERTTHVFQVLSKAHPGWNIMMHDLKGCTKILRIINPENISKGGPTLLNYINKDLKSIFHVVMETGEIYRDCGYISPSGDTFARFNLVDDFSYSVLLSKLTV